MSVRRVREKKSLHRADTPDSSRLGYEELFDAVNEALFILNMKGKFIDVNQRACEMFRIDRSTFLTSSFATTSLGQSPYSVREACELMHRAVAERPQRFEWISRRGDGELFWTEILLRPCTLNGVQRLLASLRDITWRKEAEGDAARARTLTDTLVHAVPAVASAFDAMESERVALQAYSTKMEAVGRLACGIAHDFNNLLTVTQVNLDLMVGANVKDFESYHRSIQMMLGRAMGLTRRLLTFSTSAHVNIHPFKLGEVIREIEALVEPLLGKSVRLEVSIDEGMASVNVDRAMVEQVVLNVVLNAYDAMPLGGCMQITAKNLELAESDIGSSHQNSVLVPGSYLEIAVIDDGEGIPPDVLARVFEQFFTTKPIGKGTGLGLSSSLATIRQAGGDIVITSEVGKGTRVRIIIPHLARRSDEAT